MPTTIYKLTNKITGKSYIGKTKHKIATRVAQHNYHAIKIEKRHSKLNDAIEKYGIDEFTVDILDNSHNEEYYIEKFDTFHSGYNSTSDGKQGSGQGAVIFKIKCNRTKLWWVTSPCGAIFWISNLAKLGRDAGLDRGILYHVANGRYTSYRGWKVERV